MEFPAGNGRLPLGYRFHPTDVELVVHYLKRKVLGKRLESEAVLEVDIYQFHPKDLRDRACLNKDLNSYFFCARGKKYVSGDRTNRATESGYWKATGNDRVVLYRQRTVGKVKTLVFHQGKPPKGERTDWVMHEYRLEDSELANQGIPQGAFVLCKIFKKGGLGPRNGEQFGSPYNEEEWDEEEITYNAPMADQDQITVANHSFSGAVSVSYQIKLLLRHQMALMLPPLQRWLFHILVMLWIRGLFLLHMLLLLPQLVMILFKKVTILMYCWVDFMLMMAYMITWMIWVST